MTEEEREKLDDAILKLMGTVEWKLIAENLNKDIYNIQANMLEVNSWDEVNRLKGFCHGIAYVTNLRDSVILAKKEAEKDANV